MPHSYTRWKHWNTTGFPTFSTRIEMEYWPEMDEQNINEWKIEYIIAVVPALRKESSNY